MSAPRLKPGSAASRTGWWRGPWGSPEDLDRYVAAGLDRVGNNTSALTSRLVRGTYLAVEVVAGVFLSLTFSFFFVKDGERMTRWALGHLDGRHHSLAKALGRRAWATLGAYLRATAVVGLVNATVIGLGLVLIGVPLVAPLAALTFLGAFFPLVGAVAAGAMAALVALVCGGPFDALLVLGLVVVVQQVEGDVLAPLVMGRALNLHLVVILLALTTGAVAAGLLGAFLAVPLTAVGVAVGNELRIERRPTPAEEPS